MVTKDIQWCTFKVLRLSNTIMGITGQNMQVRALTFLHLISPSSCACACACIDLFALDYPHHPVCAPVHMPLCAPVCALTFLHLISPSCALYVHLYAHWPFCTWFSPSPCMHTCTGACTRIDLFALFSPSPYMCPSMRACTCTCMHACALTFLHLIFPITLYVHLYAHLYLRLYAHWPFCTWFSPSPCTRACTRIDLFALDFPHHPVCAPVRALTFLHLIFPITLYACLYMHWPFCTWFSPSPCMHTCTRGCTRIELFALDFPHHHIRMPVRALTFLHLIFSITLYARLYAHWPFCTWFSTSPCICACTRIDLFALDFLHHPVCTPVRALTFLHLIFHITLYARLYTRLYAHWPFCTWFSPSPCTCACTRIDLFALDFPHHPVCMPVCALTFLHLIFHITLYARLYARLYAHWPFCTWFSPSPCTRACTRIDLFALDFPHHPVCAPVRALTFLHLIFHITLYACLYARACMRIDLFALDFPHHPVCAPVRALTFL